MVDDTPKYGRALRNHRVRCDLNMGDLADALGLKVGYVSDVERDQIRISPETMLAWHNKVHELWLSRNAPVVLEIGRTTIVESVGDPAEFKRGLEEDHE